MEEKKKQLTAEMLELLPRQTKLLANWNAEHIGNDDCIEQIRRNVETECRVANYLVSLPNEETV